MRLEKKAVVLLSGGMDSTTTLALSIRDGFRAYTLSFRYGQCHEFELSAARKIAKRAGVARHIIYDIDLRIFGGSALTTSAMKIPHNRTTAEMGSGIPATYVPARNTIFLSLALAWAEVLEASDIFLGVNALDYSGYPDCRPEYIDAYQSLANLATKASVEGEGPITIHTPLIRLTKAQIIHTGLELGVDYKLTHSCYDPDQEGRACGTCDACKLRLKGFAECGVSDPASYQKGISL